MVTVRYHGTERFARCMVVQWRAVITRCNIARHCIIHWSDRFRTLIKAWYKHIIDTQSGSSLHKLWYSLVRIKACTDKRHPYLILTGELWDVYCGGNWRRYNSTALYVPDVLYWDTDINSLRPSDAVWRQWSWTTLAQVLACCLTEPSHYLNQCWLIISKVLWDISREIPHP